MSNNQSTDVMEEVIDIGVHTKVTKGGRNLSFSALVAVGNGRGKVGIGYGKARGVPAAIEKAIKRARGEMEEINLIGDTVAHEIVGRHLSSKVLIKPASLGTGVKAGSTVRSMMKVLGVHNVLSKSFGRNNPLNLAKATMNALTSLRSPEYVERIRGVKPQLDHPQGHALVKEEDTGEEQEEKAEAEEAESAQASEEEETEEAEGTEESQEAEASAETAEEVEAKEAEAEEATEEVAVEETDEESEEAAESADAEDETEDTEEMEVAEEDEGEES